MNAQDKIINALQLHGAIDKTRLVYIHGGTYEAIDELEKRGIIVIFRDDYFGIKHYTINKEIK